MSYKGTYEGNSLRHYRTKGSRNGISKNPDYKPIGKLAKGPKYYDSRRDDPDWEQNDNDTWQLSKSANDRLWKESFAETGEMYKNIGKKAGEGLLNVFTKGAYGRSKKLGKLIAEKVVDSNNTNNSNNAKAVPVYKPNDKSPTQKSNMKAAEERRISGGNTGMTRSANAKPLLSGTQAVGMKGVGAYNAYADKKKYEETRKANQQAAEARRTKGGSQGTSFDSSKKAQYDAEQRRIKGGSQGTSFDRQKAAEQRRIAGSKLGSGYVDSGAGNFRRGVKLAGQAIKERMNPNHEQRSMNKHYGQVINETVSKYHAKQAAKEIGTGIKKSANYGKSLVKKGKKKVRSLMKRIFN